MLILVHSRGISVILFFLQKINRQKKSKRDIRKQLHCSVHFCSLLGFQHCQSSMILQLLIPFWAHLCRAGLNLILDFGTWPLLQDERAAASSPTLTSSSPLAGSGKVCVLCQQRLPEDNLSQLASWLQCSTDHVHTPDGKVTPPR